MTIAGSDPSGGAGIQADIKTFTLLGCYAQSVITSLTVQSTFGVKKSVAVEASLVEEQLDAVLSDWMPQVIKIGIVPNKEVAEVLVRCFRRYNISNIVFDPVLVASSGLQLVSDEACHLLFSELMPLCRLITPNLPEAQHLLKTQSDDSVSLAQQLSKVLGHNTSVLVKGGHSDGNPVDVLCENGHIYKFSAQRIVTKNSHGTGCVLSSAIASHLCKGTDLATAVSKAKLFVTNALEKGKDYNTGRGTGPLYLL